MRIRIEGWIRNNTGVMYFLLFFILISFSKIIFLTNYHYSTDSIFINYNGFASLLSIIIDSNGRLIFWLFTKITYLSGLNVGDATQLSLVLAIVAAAFTSTIIIRKINHITGGKENNTLLFLLVSLVFTSPLILELFYFYESFVMQLSIMFSVLAANIIASEYRTRPTRILIAATLLVMTLLSYQTSFVVFVVYVTVLLALNARFNIKNMFYGTNIKRIIDSIFALVIGFSFVAVLFKLVMNVSRANQLDISQLFSLANYSALLGIFKMIYSSSSSLYIGAYLILFFSIIAIMMAKKQYFELLNCIIIQAIMVLETLVLSILPIAMSKGQIIEPRMMAGAVFCISLVPIIFIGAKQKVLKFVFVLPIPLIILLIINVLISLRWQRASIDNGKIDAEWSDSVSSIIKSNPNIKKAIRFQDARIEEYSNRPVSYPAGVTSVNMRASMTEWSTIESLYLYSGLRLSKFEATKGYKYFEYQSYCSSNDWDNFNPDQVKFAEDAVIICVY